jgi:hypothetical protein
MPQGVQYYLLAPYLLEDLTRLSISVSVSGLVGGLLLWLLGGKGHRFWLVLGTTAVAGLAGLRYGPDYGMQPLVAGLFLGVSAGALALALMRILAFLTVGFLVFWVARLLAPSWEEELACFLAGGLAGVVLFRLWVAVLTSLLGTLVMGYSSLALAARVGNVDIVGLAQRNGPLLNWAVAGGTALGLLMQFLVYRRGKSKKKDEDVELVEDEKPKASSVRGGRSSWFARAQKNTKKAS